MRALSTLTERTYLAEITFTMPPAFLPMANSGLEAKVLLKSVIKARKVI